MPLTNIQCECIFISSYKSSCRVKGLKFISAGEMEPGNYTIGEFAKLLGVSPRTVDFYTRQGLLHPEQPGRGHGYRHYSEEDRRRVSLIKQLQAKKFSLLEIRQALETSRDRKNGSPAEAIEQVALDLERLQASLEGIGTSVSALDQRAIRTVATEALQRATALCSVLVTILHDMPPL
jgi:MerR family transcriptional regulator, copper efflux regulator